MAGRASTLDGLGLAFQETMAGTIGADRPLRFDVEVRIPDLGDFLRQPEHRAGMTGRVTCPEAGGSAPISDGRFQLFVVDAPTGMRQMRYFFRFPAAGGRTYCLSGHKDLRDDPGLDVIEDLTCLHTEVHAGPDETAPVYGAGDLHFALKDLPALAGSLRVAGAHGWSEEIAARLAFASFAWGAVRDEYLSKLRLFYDTRYENLALAGALRGGSPFFLVSGVHDKGFPWGDGELFWDVLLAIGNGHGAYRRYAITDRVLDGLRLDLERGIYRYSGPLFAIQNGYAASFSEMRKPDPRLSEVWAEIDIDFHATALDAVPFPFPLVKPRLRHIASQLQRQIRAALPGENPLGIFITPHQVAVRSGAIRLGEELQQIEPGRSGGEAERGTFRNVKEPTLLYGYLCALRPEAQTARVQIAARALRNERQLWTKDRLDAAIGAVVERSSAADMRIANGALSVSRLAQPLRKIGNPILEVNNDHFPTAVFQRRIVEVEDGSGARALALEEDMRLMHLEAIGCNRRTTVAAIRGDDPLDALERVLEATGFDALLDAKLRASGKTRAQFQIVIKPNFMFAYDRRDRSTYTDPQLVDHLARHLRARGFASIFVVEAQSTYGEYFDNRSVREMADYLGYDEGVGYRVVDMTLDAVEQRDLGPHLGVHPVSRAWRTADFRISFAKNKTHAYAVYSLTLKNIYGALPLANKFREYHCRRGIYNTAIEYLTAFPVDFGLIDAWLSADGPFGVFADPAPNQTQTILGGEDLVAVDWVGASKMGIDPLLSPYMQLAVARFGKPDIEFVGDANPYRPWLNVPPVVTLAAHHGMDAEYCFGNLLYSVAAQMDETHFHHKSRAWYVKLLRYLTVPLRRAFFLRAGEERSAANRFLSWLFYRLGF